MFHIKTKKKLIRITIGKSKFKPVELKAVLFEKKKLFNKRPNEVCVEETFQVLTANY